jgi:hypothetical protein
VLIDDDRRWIVLGFDLDPDRSFKGYEYAGIRATLKQQDKGKGKVLWHGNNPSWKLEARYDLSVLWSGQAVLSGVILTIQSDLKHPVGIGVDLEPDGTATDLAVFDVAMPCFLRVDEHLQGFTAIGAENGVFLKWCHDARWGSWDVYRITNLIQSR